MTSLDAESRKLRYGTCLDCGRRYSTVEVTVPDPHSLFTLSGIRKTHNRMQMRKRRGYHGTRGGAPIKPEPVLDVEVKVRTRA